MATDDADAAVRFHAATALGRAPHARSVDPILVTLETEEDFFTRYAMFTALNRIGRAEPKAWPEILKGLHSESERVRAITTYALRNTYDAALATALADYAGDRSKPAASRALALKALAPLHRQPKPWNGQW